MGLDERKTLGLGGEWRFTESDSTSYSVLGFDDSNWSIVSVPADWGSLEFVEVNHYGFAWYRKTFNVSKNNLMARFLRFDRIMDVGEVWLNGVKLLNPDPALCDLLKDKQFGSFGYKISKDTPYVHTYPMEWPYMFPIESVLREGENQLAVRVFNDKRTSEAGIVGDVYLVLTPDIYISNVRLIPGREVSSDKQANFTFEVSIVNQGSSFDGGLRMMVSCDGVRMPGEDESSLMVANSSMALVNLTWCFEPRLERYVARIVLFDENGTVDLVDQDFHGTIVEVRGNQFFVNGERFIFKGLNFAYPRDFDTMRWLGLNGIRIDHPDPEHIDLGLETGIMYAPLVGYDSCRAILDAYEIPDSPYNEMEMQLQVLAMWNFPNVIIWNMANEMGPPPLGGGHNDTVMELYLKKRYEAAHAVDAYHRPVSYSNIFWLQYSFWQDIVGTNVYGRDPDIVTTKPLFMTEWGSGHKFLRKSWEQVVLEDEWGVMGATMWPGAGISPAIRDVGINDPDPAVRDTFRWAVRDFLQDLSIQVVNQTSQSNQTSGEMIIILENRRVYSMENITVRITPRDSGRIMIRELGRIGPRGSLNITIKDWTLQPLEVRVDYQTHGGLKAFNNLSTLANTDHTYPRESSATVKYFRHGLSFTLNLTEPCDWNITVQDPDGNVIDFKTGSGESVSMTWNVTSMIDELTPGWYNFILDLRDMAGNQASPINRYRYPIPGHVKGILTTLLVISSLRAFMRRRIGTFLGHSIGG